MSDKFQSIVNDQLNKNPIAKEETDDVYVSESVYEEILHEVYAKLDEMAKLSPEHEKVIDDLINILTNHEEGLYRR